MQDSHVQTATDLKASVDVLTVIMMHLILPIVNRLSPFQNKSGKELNFIDGDITKQLLTWRIFRHIQIRMLPWRL